MSTHENPEIHLSRGIEQQSGWGATEYDEFGEPFQWVGQNAVFTIASQPERPILYLYAGSPDFDGVRNLTVTVGDTKLTSLINPGWRPHQFDLGPVLSPGDSSLEVSIFIDRLLDIPGDSRELGLMIKAVRRHDRWKSASELGALRLARKLERRVKYYSADGAPGILWLASYPRSGNTWVRFLLTNLLFEEVNKSRIIADYIDEIVDPLYPVSRPTDRSVTVFGSKSVNIVKTHLPFCESMPLRDQTAGAIYILRNPLDVAVSLWKRRIVDSENALNSFLTRGLVPDVFGLQDTSWQAHVHGWLQQGGSTHSYPVILVKYEDLVSDTFATCAKILDWLGIERSPGHVQRAVDLSSIGHLRKIEAAEVKNEVPGIFFTLERKAAIKAGRRFLADAKSNNYRGYLTEDQVQLGMETFGAEMSEFNYVRS